MRREWHRLPFNPELAQNTGLHATLLQIIKAKALNNRCARRPLGKNTSKVTILLMT